MKDTFDPNKVSSSLQAPSIKGPSAEQMKQRYAQLIKDNPELASEGAVKKTPITEADVNKVIKKVQAFDKKHAPRPSRNKSIRIRSKPPVLKVSNAEFDALKKLMEKEPEPAPSKIEKILGKARAAIVIAASHHDQKVMVEVDPKLDKKPTPFNRKKAKKGGAK